MILTNIIFSESVDAELKSLQDTRNNVLSPELNAFQINLKFPKIFIWQTHHYIGEYTSCGTESCKAVSSWVLAPIYLFTCLHIKQKARVRNIVLFFLLTQLTKCQCYIVTLNVQKLSLLDNFFSFEILCNVTLTLQMCYFVTCQFLRRNG